MPMTREQILQREAACRVFQERADDVLSTWGVRAPAPVVSTDPDYPERYRRELAYMIKKRLPENVELFGVLPDPKQKVNTTDFLNMQVKSIPFSVFEVIEPQLYRAGKIAGTRNDSVPKGEMRMVEKVNPQNGQKFIEFYGTRSFVHDFKAPFRYVRGFLTNHGYWNTAGRYVHEK
jgi:hypothetical protein